MRVCVLQCHDESEGELAGLDPYRTPEIHDKEGKYEWEHAYIKKATAVAQVRDLAKSKKYDVFLNLCDGAFDEDRAGIEVVQTLERYNCAYTGADAGFYEPSKELMKKMAFYYDIPTAPFAFIYDIDMEDDQEAACQCSAAVEGLKFPLIVKHYNGYSSVGMGKDCKVHDMAGLIAQVRKFVRGYGGALVEEFITGREFTVLVVENPGDPQRPQALVPVECSFSEGEEFKHFDVKWKEYEGMEWSAIDAEKEPELDAALRKASVMAFLSLKGCSYGRCDFRVDAQGNIYFLEINPNCGIFYPMNAYGSADVILSLDPKTKHSQFIDRIIQCALARRDRKLGRRLTEVRYQHTVGYALFATRDISVGEVVVHYEERAHVIATRQHIARTFGLSAVPDPCPVGLPGWKGLDAYKAQQDQLRKGSKVNGTAEQPQQQPNGVRPPEDESNAAHGENCNGQPAGADAEDGFNLHKLKAQWFKSYAYPISDEVWVTWSEDPDDWLPLNHGCDPNTHLVGLNLVACKPIKKGDHITADYATYSVHNMHEFQCHCGAARCRGLIKGTDYLEPWVDELYGDHVSEYVALKRAEAKAKAQALGTDS